MIRSWAHRLRDREGQLADRFDALPLQRRRILALLSYFLVFVSAALVVFSADASFVHAREVVATEPRRNAVITKIDYGGRGSEYYYVEIEGQEREIDFAHFLPDKSIGAEAVYVVDPLDPEHLIAVGSPSDWSRDFWWDALSLGVSAVVVLFFAGLVAGRMVPEDGGAILGKLLPDPKNTRARRRRRRRKGGGSGRHVD